MEKIVCVVPAAGAGKRMGLGYNKAFADLGGAPVLVQTLKMLAQTELCSEAVVVLAPEETEAGKAMLARYKEAYFASLPVRVTAGGKERQDSVANALATLGQEDVLVAVHDGARPFAGKEVFARTAAAARRYGAAVAAVPLKDTVKIVDEQERVTSTPSRTALRAVQTPQIFRLSLLQQAYAHLAQHPAAVTDDASVVELYGHPVQTVFGSYENIKITTPEDMRTALSLIGRSNGGKGMDFRVGSGFDVHRLVTGRRLILCGVEVPWEKGLLGHSDADVALHALMDALLGAAGLGDIGRHFPDTDPGFKDADSVKLTEHVVRLLQQDGWRVGNVDITVLAQRPKLALHIEAMRGKVAKILQIEISCVNIKATTTEELGFVGRGEGMAAQAAAIIIRDR